MTLCKRVTLSTLTLLTLALSHSANAAIGLDRTRVIFDGGKDATSVNITNNNTQLPYLAQGWIENEEGQKLTTPLIVLPPVQRLEPGKQSQVKVQALPAAKSLPQDRETVYYFNLREIPPRTDKANTLQIALQTRIKLFWRPKALEKVSMKSPWQHKVTLTRSGQAFTVNNPTPYYVIISNASAQKNGNPAAGFSPLVIEPKTTVPLNVKMDSVPVLTYVNDFGARMPLFFQCNGNSCQVDEEQSRKG